MPRKKKAKVETEPLTDAEGIGVIEASDIHQLAIQAGAPEPIVAVGFGCGHAQAWSIAMNDASLNSGTGSIVFAGDATGWPSVAMALNYLERQGRHDRCPVYVVTTEDISAYPWAVRVKP